MMFRSMFLVVALCVLFLSVSESSAKKCFDTGKLTSAFMKLKDKSADGVKGLLSQQNQDPSKKDQIASCVTTCYKNNADKDGKKKCMFAELTKICPEIKPLSKMLGK